MRFLRSVGASGRTLPGLVAVLAFGCSLTGCGGSSPKTTSPGLSADPSSSAPSAAASGRAAGAGGTPFTGTWQTGAGGAQPGDGDTTLTVAADGTLRFNSARDCTGRVAPASGAYRFTFDCGASKFTGTAPFPKGKTFVMTWDEGDSSEFHAAP